MCKSDRKKAARDEAMGIGFMTDHTLSAINEWERTGFVSERGQQALQAAIEFVDQVEQGGSFALQVGQGQTEKK